MRQRELDEAQQRLAELRSQRALASELADGNLLEAWPTLGVTERRRLYTVCSTELCSVAPMGAAKVASRWPNARRSSCGGTSRSSRPRTVRSRSHRLFRSTAAETRKAGRASKKRSPARSGVGTPAYAPGMSLAT